MKRVYIDDVLDGAPSQIAAAEALGLSREGLYKMRARLGMEVAPRNGERGRRCVDCGERLPKGRRADWCALCGDARSRLAAARWQRRVGAA